MELPPLALMRYSAKTDTHFGGEPKKIEKIETEHNRKLHIQKRNANAEFRLNATQSNSTDSDKIICNSSHCWI